jgi:dihydrofolate reductase
VVGRELFDVTDGWKGTHPLGVPVVVLTHEPPTDWDYPDAVKFFFVTDGIEAAVARAQQVAGEKNVGVAAGTIARQCLEAGLLDEVAVDLVPVVMGKGRPYFGELADGHPHLLGDPTTLIQGERVTHLVFPVKKE